MGWEEEDGGRSREKGKREVEEERGMKRGEERKGEGRGKGNWDHTITLIFHKCKWK